VDDTTPGDPDGPLSSSTSTGCVADTVSGATVNMATGWLAPRTATSTCAAADPGLATARVDTPAFGVPGALGIPGPGTSQWVATVVVADDEPHTGGVEPGGACTERPTTIGTVEVTVTA
jgi:hypothetical protein